MLADLAGFAAEGYTFATWNGVSFDFDILAEESGERDICIGLAIDHVDLMFHVLCSRGYCIARGEAADGMSIPSKLGGVSGADAPAMWAAGEHERVLDYNVQDASVTAKLAARGDQARQLRWITQGGTRSTMALPHGWMSVRDALELPVPDTSWMTDPPSRADFMRWVR